MSVDKILVAKSFSEFVNKKISFIKNTCVCQNGSNGLLLFCGSITLKSLPKCSAFFDCYCVSSSISKAGKVFNEFYTHFFLISCSSVLNTTQIITITNQINILCGEWVQNKI